MENSRRDFIRKSTSLAALTVGGSPVLQTDIGTGTETSALAKDAGIQLCGAYFNGMEAVSKRRT